MSHSIGSASMSNTAAGVTRVFLGSDFVTVTKVRNRSLHDVCNDILRTRVAYAYD